MHLRTLALALGAIALGGSASAQDALPYYQRQRVVLIFKVDEPLVARTFDGSEVSVLPRGFYRYEGQAKSQSVLTAANFADQTGPYARYRNGPQGEIRTLFGGAKVRDAHASLKLLQASFNGRRNVVDAADLALSMQVQLDAMSSTTVRMQGEATRDGAFVPGSMQNLYNGQPGKITVFHTFLSLEDHLPQVKPEAFFPARLRATASPTAKEEIEAGDYGFDLTRDEQTELGVQRYESFERFPMVEESDYYGDYESSPTRPQLLVKEDGDLHLEFGWSLAGRYHGWSHTYTATLTPAQYRELLDSGRLVIQGAAAYRFGSEDEAFDVETPCAITLELPAATGLAGALGS
ncbi:MAG: hypothetical protein R3F62_18190 [Planctomycetota bacterium]